MEMAVADVESNDVVNFQQSNQFPQQENNFLSPENSQTREGKANAKEIQRDPEKVNGTNKLKSGFNQKERKSSKVKKGMIQLRFAFIPILVLAIQFITFIRDLLDFFSL